MLIYPNRSDTGSYSGGAWVEAMPLDNLKARQFAQVARSIGLQPSSTTFTIDFGRSWSIRLFAFIAHNFTASARIRIEASNSETFANHILDQTFDAYGALVNADWDINSLEWENDNYWLGSYTAEDTEGQTPISTQLFPQNVVARYWRVTIFDGSNTAGFIQIGRLFLGEVFLQPTYNPAYGGDLGYEDGTGVDTSLSGAEFFDPREPIRVMRFQLQYLNDEEGYSRALELTRRAGVWKEVFVIGDPDDALYSTQRNFPARLRQLNPLESVMYGYDTDYHSMAMELKEIR